MATRYKLRRPNGTELPLYYKSSEERMENAKQLLNNWTSYCEENWLANGANGMAEKNVKSFLDQVGYLMLRDNPDGTMSEYKEKARAETELPVSCRPGPIQALFYGEGNGDDTLDDPETYCRMPRARQEEKAKEKAKQEKTPPKRKKKELEVNRRARLIDQIHMDLPGGTFTFARVDTENVFFHEGKKYRIDLSVEAYKPRMYRGEMMYCMDTIVVVRHEGSLHFYNQDYVPVEQHLITEYAE